MIWSGTCANEGWVCGLAALVLAFFAAAVLAAGVIAYWCCRALGTSPVVCWAIAVAVSVLAVLFIHL